MGMRAVAFFDPLICQNVRQPFKRLLLPRRHLVRMRTMVTGYLVYRLGALDRLVAYGAEDVGIGVKAGPDLSLAQT